MTALLLLALIYGFIVECRATMTKKHNTDLGVYLAAAQAIRENGDVYTTRYNRDHYMYPPFLAILLTHIVPAPDRPGQPTSEAFAITVNLWYDLSVLALAGAIFFLAKTLSSNAPESLTSASENWRPVWTLRLLPVILCLHCLGRELQLGQIDLFLLFLVVMTMTAAAQGRSYQAGLWNAAAICLKVMPVLFLLFPLWRRDWRWLLSCLGGMVIGLVILPLALLGFDKTVKYTREYEADMVLPAINGKIVDHSRDGEMLNQNAVHNYSILGVMHNLEYISQPRDERPKQASVFNRHLALAVGVILSVLTLTATGFRRRISPTATIDCLAMLTAVMIIGSPVCQSYYFVLLIPLFMAVTFAGLKHSGSNLPSLGIIAVCIAYPIAQVMASISPLLRDCGLVLATVLLLWGMAYRFLRREAKGAVI